MHALTSLTGRLIMCTIIILQPQKPDGEILLSSITKLETEATKDATYPFQVHFKGKAQNGAGSPWAFDLDSNVRVVAAAAGFPRLQPTVAPSGNVVVG